MRLAFYLFIYIYLLQCLKSSFGQNTFMSYDDIQPCPIAETENVSSDQKLIIDFALDSELGLLYTIHKDQTIIVWDFNKQKMINQVSLNGSYYLVQIKLFKSGKYLLVISEDGTFVLLDSQTLNVKNQANNLSSPVYQQISEFWVDESRQLVVQKTFQNQVILNYLETGQIISYSDLEVDSTLYFNYFQESGEILIQSQNKTFYNYDCFKTKINQFKFDNFDTINQIVVGQNGEYFGIKKDQNSIYQVFRFINDLQHSNPSIIYSNTNNIVLNSLIYILADATNLKLPTLYVIGDYNILQMDIKEKKETVIQTIISNQKIQIVKYDEDFLGLIYIDYQNKLHTVTSQLNTQIPIIKQDMRTSYSESLSYQRLQQVQTVKVFNRQIFAISNYAQFNLLVFDTKLALIKQFTFNPSINFMDKNNFNTLPSDSSYESTYVSQDAKILIKENYLVKYSYNLVEVYHLSELIYEISEDSYIVGAYIHYVAATQYLLIIKQNSSFNIRQLKTGIIINSQILDNTDIYNYEFSPDFKYVTFFGYQSDSYSVIKISAWSLDENMKLVGISSGAAICKGEFIKMDIAKTNNLLLVLCNYSFTFMKISDKMSILYTKIYTQQLYLGFHDVDIKYLIIFGNTNQLFVETLTYVLPSTDGNLATLTTYHSSTYVGSFFTKGLLNTATAQKKITLFNPVRIDIFHYYYVKKMNYIQYIYIAPIDGKMTDSNYITFYSKTDFRYLYSYYSGSSYYQSIYYNGAFSVSTGISGINIYGLYFNSTSKIFYGSAEGNRVFYFEQMSALSALFKTETQFYDIQVDSSHIYSLSTDTSNSILSVKYNLNTNQAIQYHYLNYVGTDYKDICFNTNKTYAVVITEKSALIASIINLAISKNLGDSVLANVIQCFGSSTHFGVLYQSDTFQSEIAIYSQDTQFTFLGLVKSSDSSLITSFVITSTQVIYKANNSLYTSSFPNLQDINLNSFITDVQNLGNLLQLVVYNDNVYAFYQKSLYIFSSDLEVIASLRIIDGIQYVANTPAMAPKLTIQTPVLIELQNLFSKITLDIDHQLIWIESEVGEILIHDLVSLKQKQIYKDSAKFSYIAHSMIFTKNEAFVCWRAKCFNFIYTQSLQNGIVAIDVQKESKLIELNISISITKLLYDEMLQGFLLCSVDTDKLNIYSKSGTLIRQMNNFSTSNKCKNVIMDTLYNRVYFLGKTYMYIYDLSFFLLGNSSKKYNNLYFLRNPFIYPESVDASNNSQLQKVYIPNRDGVVKIYDFHESFYDKSIYIDGLRQIKAFKDNLLLARTKDEIILIDRFTKQILKRDIFANIIKYDVLLISSKIYAFVTYDKGQIAIFEYDSNYILIFKLNLNLNVFITVIQTDGIMMIAADSLNNLYDINIAGNSFITLPYSVLSDIPISSLTINSKHQVLIVIYDGWKAEMYSRKGVSNGALAKVIGLNISEQFKINGSTTNTVYGINRGVIYEEDRQLVYILSENLGRLFVFQYQENFSKIAAFKLINVPVRQSKFMVLKLFPQIKAIAIITAYQIDMLNQETLSVFQQFRDQSMLQITNFHLVSIFSDKIYLGIVTTTFHLYIYIFDQTNFVFNYFKKYPLDMPTFLFAQTKPNPDEINVLQIVGFTQFGATFTISINLQLQEQEITQQSTQCMIQIKSPTYGLFQYIFTSLEAGRLFLKDPTDIQTYRFVIKDSFNQLNFQLPDFSNNYTIDFIGNSSSSSILNITNSFLSNLNAIELYFENLQIISENSEVVFNKNLTSTNPSYKSINSIIFQSTLFNTEETSTSFIFQNLQSISFRDISFKIYSRIVNQNYIQVKGTLEVEVKNLIVQGFSLINSNFIQIIGLDIENQQEKFDQTKIQIEQFDFLNFKLYQSKAVHLEMVKTAELKKLNFIDNEMDDSLEKGNNDRSILIQLSGISSIQISSTNFTNNINTQLINYSPSYQDGKFENLDVEKTLTVQHITINDGVFFKNIISKDQFSLIQINAKYVEFQNVTYGENVIQKLNIDDQEEVLIEVQETEASINNIFGAEELYVYKAIFTLNQAEAGTCFNIKNTIKFKIEASSFSNNTALTYGGALKLYNTEEFKFYVQTFYNQIISCNFVGNRAGIGGGAIYSKSTNYTLHHTIIKENFSSIGGAIRCLDRTPPFPDAQVSTISSSNRKLTADVYNNTVSNNKATIFGQNFGSYPLAIRLNNQIVNSEIIFKDFRSSDKLTGLSIELLGMIQQKTLITNEELNPVRLNTKLNGVMSTKELAIIQLQNTNARAYSNDIFIKDQITAKYDVNKYTFQNLYITGIPGSTLDLFIEIPTLRIFNYKSEAFLQAPPLKIKIEFRKCVIGEIYEFICPTCLQFACKTCEEGTYSLLDPNLNTISACKLCPFEQATYCKKDTIILKQGYWRKGQFSDDILYCQNAPENCYGKEQNNYCVEGFAGPLCETCDIEKLVWQERYGQVSNQSNTCYKCSEIEFSLTTLLLPFIGILAYTVFTIYKISSRADQYLHSTYLRKCRILAVGTSGQTDKFTLYSKFLMNFFQISMSIRQMKVSIPVEIFRAFNILGDPISSSQFSLDCYLESLPFKVPIAYMRIIWSQAIPISLFFLMLFGYLFLVLFRCVKFEKKYIYTMLLMLLIFMQTGIAQILFKSISCRQFGESGLYMLGQLTEECWTSRHFLYTFALIIPAIVFWIVFVPFLFYYRLLVAARKNKLDRFETIQKYGYIYQEYRQSKFYWEFIKMYQRVLIILSLVLFNNYPIEQGFCISFIILLYIYLSFANKPYLNQQINLIDQRSSLVQLVIILLATLYNSTNHVISKDWLIFALFTIQGIFIIYLVILLVNECLKSNTSSMLAMLKRNIVKKYPYFSKYLKSITDNPWRKLSNWQVLRLNIHLWMIKKKLNNSIEWEDYANSRSKDVKSMCIEISQFQKNKSKSIADSKSQFKNSGVNSKSLNDNMQIKQSIYADMSKLQSFEKTKNDQDLTFRQNQLNVLRNQNRESNDITFDQQDNLTPHINLDHVSEYSLVSSLVPSEIKSQDDEGKKIYKRPFFDIDQNEIQLPQLKDFSLPPYNQIFESEKKDNQKEQAKSDKKEEDVQELQKDGNDEENDISLINDSDNEEYEEQNEQNENQKRQNVILRNVIQNENNIKSNKLRVPRIPMDQLELDSINKQDLKSFDDMELYINQYKQDLISEQQKQDFETINSTQRRMNNISDRKNQQSDRTLNQNYSAQKRLSFQSINSIPSKKLINDELQPPKSSNRRKYSMQSAIQKKQLKKNLFSNQIANQNLGQQQFLQQNDDFIIPLSSKDNKLPEEIPRDVTKIQKQHSLQALDVFIDIDEFSQNIVNYRKHIKTHELLNKINTLKSSDIMDKEDNEDQIN